MLTPNYDHAIPEMTVEVVKAAFPKGNAVMKIRDDLGPLFADDEFAALYPAIGQPAENLLLDQILEQPITYNSYRYFVQHNETLLAVWQAGQ